MKRLVGKETKRIKGGQQKHRTGSEFRFSEEEPKGGGELIRKKKESLQRRRELVNSERIRRPRERVLCFRSLEQRK